MAVDTEVLEGIKIIRKERGNQYIDNSWPGNSGKGMWNAECG